ncbi:MAG TPA: putative 4-mercaptohistidine N1-methyltransferase [Chthoniobacteraceae bacterium]|nr:putative 4-mercaptohistidine N1-methyltransferase [Chthoniobacteraceae bacterium]
MNIYETDAAVSQYLLFHYGAPEERDPFQMLPNVAAFPSVCVQELPERGSLPANARALDLGCAVGRSTFELTRLCAEVIGLDSSAAFIRAAQALKETGIHPYTRMDEGALRTSLIARVPEKLDRTRVSFRVGDAMNVPADLGSFDLVVMANLIDRLPDPARCLQQLPALVRRGGQVVITSPCTWLEEFTPRDKWLGGFERNGRAFTTLDALKEILGRDFEFRFEQDVPFLIWEHRRKFQHSVAQASVWLRR